MAWILLYCLYFSFVIPYHSSEQYIFFCQGFGYYAVSSSFSFSFIDLHMLNYLLEDFQWERCHRQFRGHWAQPRREGPAENLLHRRARYIDCTTSHPITHNCLQRPDIIRYREEAQGLDETVLGCTCSSSRHLCGGWRHLVLVYPLNDAAETVNVMGSSISRVMGGTSGIMYTILCKAAYASLKANGQSDVTSNHWAEALEASTTAVSKYGGAIAGFRTLLDALIPASQALQQRLKAGDDTVTAFVLSSEAALAGAESTKLMQAQLT